MAMGKRRQPRRKEGEYSPASPAFTYDYAADEREFLEAVDRYKAAGRPHPTLKELLDILKGLGWRKTHAEAQRRGEANAD